MVIEFKGKKPKTEKAAFVAPNATLVGDVWLESGSSIWFGAVLRGDEDSITIGRGSNIQDNAVIHADPYFPVIVGKKVTVGHGAILHGCTVQDNCVIGMGAVVLNRAVIGENSIVAAGSLIAEGAVFPPNSLIAGSPAEVKKSISDVITQKMVEGAEQYEAKSRAMKEACNP